jgi:uncharacterized membrane protein YesL
MNKKNEFNEGLIFTIFNYIYWSFLSNVYFILCNLLFVFYFFTIKFTGSLESSILLIISLIPVGPALTALCSCMDKIIRDKDINITTYYFKSYKRNFKQSMKLWLIALFVQSLLISDLKFLSSKNIYMYLYVLIFVFMLYSLIIYIHMFPILSRFNLKSMDILKLSFVYSFKKFQVTLINILTIVVSGFVVYFFPSISIFFVFSLTCLCIIYYEQTILNDIENLITADPTSLPDTKYPSHF